MSEGPLPGAGLRYGASLFHDSVKGLIFSAVRGIRRQPLFGSSSIDRGIDYLPCIL